MNIRLLLIHLLPMAYLLSTASSAFTPPEVGQEITIVPKIGAPVTGTIDSLERAAVTIDGVRYEARELTEESWMLLFEEYHIARRRRALDAAAKNFGSRIEVGQIGKFDPSPLIVQVLNDKEMLVEITVNMARRSHRIGPHSTQISYERIPGDTVWIRGFPTRGFVDGRRQEIEGIFRVTGTDSYTTVVGSSRTLYTLSPVE